jgi:hypothetical protein
VSYIFAHCWLSSCHTCSFASIALEMSVDHQFCATQDFSKFSSGVVNDSLDPEGIVAKGALAEQFGNSPGVLSRSEPMKERR